MNTEYRIEYKTIGLHVLERMLDDICPKFDYEPEEIRQQLIKDRHTIFLQQETSLDKEWDGLEKEAALAVKNLTKEREQIIKRLTKSKNTAKLKLKVKLLKQTKSFKIRNLKQKVNLLVQEFKTELKSTPRNNKRYVQLQSKINTAIKNKNYQVESLTKRYDKAIDKILKVDNTEIVENKIKQSFLIWNKKYEKLKKHFEEKEMAFENKRHELDQIRFSVEGFVYEFESVDKWCNLVGIPVKICYQEAQERLRLLGRESEELNEMVDNLVGRKIL
jgi:hypothetical protein